MGIVPDGTTVIYRPQPAVVSQLATTDEPAASESLAPKRSPPQRAERLVGKTLGVYRCDTLLGRGAMGAVYLAYHQDLERRCALKVLSPKYAETDADYVQRFRQEAIAIANLHHPNVVMAYSVGNLDGLHFLEMEFVPGRSLQKLLDARGRLPIDESLRITAQIADGLAAAHRQGIIHRDVKPDNVLLSNNLHGIGTAKIGDFGLAKQVRGGRERAFDGLVGTPHYMAPELFMGAHACSASDMYALGVCLYRMLTGKLPFQGRTVKQLMSQVISRPFPEIREELPDLAPEIVNILNCLTNRDPHGRCRDADQAQPMLFAALEQIRDVRQLIAEAFNGESDITWSARDKIDEFDVIVALPRGRRQKVVIAPSESSTPFRQLQVFSVSGPASPDHYELALRRNASQPTGSIAVRDVNGKPHFVVVENYSRAKVTPDELCRSVRHIAKHADEVEDFLTGDDKH